MAEKTELLQAIDDAILDADSLERFINGSEDETVLTRLSAEYPTLQNAIKQLFVNGGLPATPFKTKALMEASELGDGSYAIVTDDTNSLGLYFKDGGSWVKSKYDTLEQSKQYTDAKTDRLSSEIKRELLEFDTGFFKHPTNLVNPDNIILNKSIAGDTGEIADSETTAITEFIPIKPNTTYTIMNSDKLKKVALYVGYYDENKSLISRPWVNTDGQTVIEVTPDNAVYAVIGLHKNLFLNNNAVFFTEGDSYNYFTPYSNKVFLDGVELGREAKDGIDPLRFLTDNVGGGINLFNPDSTLANTVVSSEGIVYETSGYWLTGFIPVKSNTTYSAHSTKGTGKSDAFINFAIFDERKEFIARVSFDAPVGGIASYTMPDNAAYVRLNVTGGDPHLYDRIFYEGSKFVEYVPYAEKTTLSDIRLADDVLDTIDPKRVLQNNVTSGINLFDYSKVTRGYIIAPDGAYTSSEQEVWITEYIEIEPNTVYTGYSTRNNTATSGFVSAAFYTKDKKFIARENFSITDDSTRPQVTTPDTAYYVRLNGSFDHVKWDTMFYKGTGLIEYIPYNDKPMLTGVSLADNVLEQIKPNKLIETYSFDVDISGTFDLKTTYSGFGDWHDRSASDVVGLYDALMAQHPDYITKHPLGQDDFGNDLAYFVFEPKQARAAVQRKLPTIFYTLSIHGTEKTPTLAAYLMMKEVCENWRSDELLQVLRFNTKIILMPVANPSGWNAPSRTNSNGVDLNRNFPSGWRKGGSLNWTYSGDEAGDQKETQAIIKVFEENPDIGAFYDFHNFNGDSTTTDYIWVAGYEYRGKSVVSPMTQRLTGRLTKKWQKEFDWIIQDDDYFAGYHATDTTGGMIRNQAHYYGIDLAATFEVCYSWQQTSEINALDATHTKTMTEAVINWTLINLQELQRLSQVGEV